MAKRKITTKRVAQIDDFQSKNIELSKRLFKYYKYDDMYNESRILGNVFLILK